MSEQILINGVPVVVPPEIVSQGREAVEAWHAEQPGATKPAPVPPAEVQAKGDRAIIEWYVEKGHPVEKAEEIRKELSDRRDKEAKAAALAAAKSGGAAVAAPSRKPGAAGKEN